MDTEPQWGWSMPNPTYYLTNEYETKCLPNRGHMPMPFTNMHGQFSCRDCHMVRTFAPLIHVNVRP